MSCGAGAFPARVQLHSMATTQNGPFLPIFVTPSSLGRFFGQKKKPRHMAGLKAETDYRGGLSVGYGQEYVDLPLGLQAYWISVFGAV